MSIRTPGLCPNIEGCDTARRGKSVWVALNDSFKCPNCRTQLSAPDMSVAPRRALAATFVVGAFVLVGGGAVFGASVMPHHGLPHREAGVTMQSE